MLNFLLGSPYGVTPLAVTPTAPVVDGQLNNLTARIDALELACAGLWKLLRDKHGYTAEELTAAIHEIDAQDGTVDGAVRPNAGQCPQCGRKLLSRTATKCLWCGAPVSPGVFSG